VIRSVIGVTLRASRAFIVESTMSFHCTPLLKPPILMELDMIASRHCI